MHTVAVRYNDDIRKLTRNHHLAAKWSHLTGPDDEVFTKFELIEDDQFRCDVRFEPVVQQDIALAAPHYLSTHQDI